MAAVAPHLEQSLTYRISDQNERSVYRMGGSGLGSIIDPMDRPAASLERNHQNLARTVSMREVANKVLEGRKLFVEFKEGGKAVLRIEPPIRRDEAPPWSPLAQDRIDGYPLLTWTKKMQCPSFSLPAGAPENGGSCIAAQHGQTTVAKDVLVSLGNKKRILQKSLGFDAKDKKQDFRLTEDRLPLWYALAVCETCYAETGAYQYFNNTVGILAVFAWTQWALETRGKSGRSLFVDTMVQAIERADYHLGEEGEEPHSDEGGSPASDKAFLRDTPWKRFFRWHDSGDVFSEEYFAQIKQICDHFNPKKGGKGTPTLFWCPTRVWAQAGSAKWAAVNDDPDTNLVVRPSAFHVNFPCPSPEDAGPGNQAGTTVIASGVADEFHRRGVFDWDCPAAMNQDTCRNTKYRVTNHETGRVQERVGCRACWIYPDKVVNYRLH